jgi:hypothetical protein
MTRWLYAINLVCDGWIRNYVALISRMKLEKNANKILKIKYSNI